MTPEYYVWLKAGDHRQEAQDLIDAFALENPNDASVGDLSVRVATTPAAAPVTVLHARGPWWEERMRIHSNGWRGGPESHVLQALGLQE